MHVGRISLIVSCLAFGSAQGACKIDVIAHRGASYAAPENTLIAIREALNSNAPYIEVDTRLSGDGVPVLMHDADVERSTNGRGPATDFTASQLSGLDAGGWKAPRFAGEPVPTLQQAIETAYPKALLYLDVKVNGLARSLAQLFEDSKLPPESVIIAVSEPAALEEYHAALPRTALAWFGAIPDDWDKAWFTMLKTHNVRAIELYWPTLQRLPSVNAFVEQARTNGIMIWTYLLNDTASFREAIALGVNGIETDFPELLAGVCDDPAQRTGPRPRVAGQWDFSASDLRATAGSQLVGVHLQQSDLSFGTTRDLGLSALPGGLAQVARIDALEPHQGLIMYPNMHPAGRGNGEFINRYSLIMDILRPSQSQGRWNALLQTDIYNRSDADLFIDPQGRIGISESYYGRLELNRWHRVAAVVDLLATAQGEMNLFIDGRPIGTIGLDGLDGRWSLYSTLSSLGTLLFSDDSNETAPLFVSSVQIRNYAMSDEEVASLGAAAATGIPGGVSRSNNDE